MLHTWPSKCQCDYGYISENWKFLPGVQVPIQLQQ